MINPHQTDNDDQLKAEDNRLAELIAHAETYHDLDSKLEEASYAVATALEAVEEAARACEEARDEAAERSDDDAYSELEDLFSELESAHSDLESASVPDTFRRRARSLRTYLEQERAASGAAPAAVSQE